MFDGRHKGKIENDEIMRWRLELSCYSFDIVYHPGKENILPDKLSRATCAATIEDSLFKLHQSLCHPRVTRLNHFVRSKNLPYSLDEIKRVKNQHPVCSEFKSQDCKPKRVPLIKATQPFERINIDFKGPLPSNNGSKYFLNIVDEYSRFPFVFPCSDVSATTVVKCLTTLFSLFRMPTYVHSDQGASFMSHELRAFLGEKGIASSQTISYNPGENGQVERYNGVVWKVVEMSLKSKNLHVKYWQDILPDVLHSIQSLLCTATNETPHECFFQFLQRSSSAGSISTWMATPGPVLLKHYVRSRKTNPIVEEVDLLQANPHYVYVRYPDGQETTVSTKHLAPKLAPKSPQIQVELKGQVSETMSVAPKDQAEADLPSPQPEHSKDIPTTVHQPTTIYQPVLQQ